MTFLDERERSNLRVGRDWPVGIDVVPLPKPVARAEDVAGEVLQEAAYPSGCQAPLAWAGCKDIHASPRCWGILTS